MAITGMTKVSVGLIDHSGEPTKVSFHIAQLDNTNFDDLFAAATGSVDLVEGAIETLSDCNTTRTTSSVTNNTDENSAPSTVTAQREIAARFMYRDTVTGTAGHFDVPGPVTTIYPATGTDNIALDNVTVAAAIVVFEANMVSPAGNPINITECRLVGRNN